MDRAVNPLTDAAQFPTTANQKPTKTNSLPTRAAPTPVHTKPQTHSQGRSLSTPDIPPTKRDEQLRDLLEQHRADRARIQRHANISKQKSEESLRQKLHDALQEVKRLDHDFQQFRRGARAQLTMALEENAALKARLSGVLNESTATDSPATGSPTSVQAYHARGGMKPTERELSVDRLQLVYNENGRASMRAPDRKVVAAGVSSPATKKEEDDDKGSRATRTASLRILRRLDGNLKGSAAAASATEKAKMIGSKKVHGKENVENRRKSTKIPRSFSRKWSTCF